MKKTGSIRVNICHEENDRYWVTMPLEGGQESEKYCVSPSAVTDIRKEVDWSKVKENTPVICRKPLRCHDDFERSHWRLGLLERENDGDFLVRFTGGYYNSSRWFGECMLPEDWLKEHGNKEDGDENG